jgi:anti-anti-sigma factor
MPHLSTNLQFLIIDGGASVVIGAHGELDVATAPALGHDLAVVRDAGTGDVLVDMSDVTFCDSAVLGTLIAGRVELACRGRRMRIVEPSPSVRHLLRIADLPQLMS